MSSQHDQLARLQSDFYRNSYHKVLRWLFVEIVIILLLLGVMMFIIFTAHTPPYYASMLGGKIVPLMLNKG